MTAHYYTSYANITTKITVIDAPAGASILAVLRDGGGNTVCSAIDTFGVTLAPQNTGKYSLEVYIVLNGSLTSILQGILDIKQALPDADTLGVSIKINSTTLATIIVNVSLLGSVDGSYIPAMRQQDGSYTVDPSVTFGSADYYTSINAGYIQCYGVEAGESTTMYLNVSGMSYQGIYGSATYAPGYARIERNGDYVPQDSDLITQGEVIKLIQSMK